MKANPIWYNYVDRPNGEVNGPWDDRPDFHINGTEYSYDTEEEARADKKEFEKYFQKIEDQQQEERNRRG